MAPQRKEDTIKKRERVLEVPIKVIRNAKGNTTSKSCWKSFERLVADFFATKRVPLSGMNSGHNTNSDTLHENLYVECKLRNKMSIFALFKDTKSKADNEGKVPVVAVKEKGSPKNDYLLIIRAEDLQKVAEYARKSNQSGFSNRPKRTSK